MGTLKSLICLSTLMWTPVFLYNTKRNIAQQHCNSDVCHYFENPNLQAFLQSKFASTPVSLRSRLFDDEEPKPDSLLKHFNVGYLNVDRPISTIGDFLGMNSDEMGMPRRRSPHKQASHKTSAVWNLDDVKNLAAPKVLPDIVLDPESPQGEVQQQAQPDSLLDEAEKEMGRFVVTDPPPKPRKRAPRRRIPSTLNVPSYVVEEVIRTTETPPNFMEELQKIKMKAMAEQQATPSSILEDIDDSLENTMTQVDEIQENREQFNHPRIEHSPPQIVHYPPQNVHSSPQIVHEPPEVIESPRESVETPNDAALVEQFLGIIRKYVESNPQMLKDYQKIANQESKKKSEKTHSRSKQSSRDHVESSTVLSESTRNLPKPTKTKSLKDDSELSAEKMKTDSATTTTKSKMKKDSNEGELNSSEEAVIPEKLSEKMGMPKREKTLPGIQNGNEI